MNEYIDYNNEEVSNYPKQIDPREHNVVNRINQLANHTPVRVADDVVTIEMMKNAHQDIVEDALDIHEDIVEDIEEIRESLNEEDDEIIIVGENE